MSNSIIEYPGTGGGGGTLTGSGTTDQLAFWSSATDLTSNYTIQRTATELGEGLEIQNNGTGVGAGNGAVLNLYLSTTSSARLGEIHFYGNNSSNAKTQLTAIYAESDGVTAGVENGIQLMNLTVNGALKEYFRASKSNNNVLLKLANTALFNEDNKSVNLGETSVPETGFKYEKSDNAGVNASFVNPNTGTSAYTAILLGTANDVGEGLRIARYGNNWGNFNAFKQKGVSIEAGTGMSGGMSIGAFHSTTGEIRFYSGGFADANQRLIIKSGGNIGVGSGTTPTALLHLPAGTATANTAPLKFTSGTNLTTGEAGAMEYDGTNLFFTRTGTTRETVLTGTTAGGPLSITSGVLGNSWWGTSGDTILGTPNSWANIVINGTAYRVPLYTP